MESNSNDCGRNILMETEGITEVFVLWQNK